LLALYIGIALSDYNIHLSASVLYITIAIFMIAAFCYPRKKGPARRSAKLNDYWVRKVFDLSIATCSFIIFCCLANNESLPAGANSFAASHSVAPGKNNNPTAQEILSSLSQRDKHSLTRPEKRVLKKEFKHQLKVYAKAKISGNKNGAEQALLILLAIIAAVGLLYLVAALACTLSCNGSDAAAVLVGILGTALVIWLLIIVIRSITHPKKKEHENTK
jgi:hypothetical protein